jgi:hypothetical protein
MLAGDLGHGCLSAGAQGQGISQANANASANGVQGQKNSDE